MAEEDQNSRTKGSPRVYTIWGYEEPENGLEISKAFEMAKEFAEIAKEIQLFVTTHSPAFYIEAQKCPFANVVYIKREKSGETKIIDKPNVSFMNEELGIMPVVAPYIRERVQEIETYKRLIKENYLTDVSYKDIKKVVADLKKIYGAVTLEEAEKNLQTFVETWRKQYPSCVKSWEENWPVLSTFFEYPVEIRKIIYTTNIIEGLNRQFRQITKNKPSFTNDDSLRRMLYLASQRIVKHWHARYQNWDLVLSQMEIMFADRAVG